ncbi:hypothetical protein EMCRGX_G012057, partial [Ephydatia muelleri]
NGRSNMTYGRWHCGKTLALNQTHSARHHEFVADALIELEYRLEIEMVIPYYYQFLLRRGPYPSYAIAITSRDNQNHRTMERRDYDVTKETHNMARSIVSPY